MTGVFWSGVQTAARLTNRLASFNTKSSLAFAGVSFTLVFLLESELGNSLGHRNAQWAAVPCLIVFLLFATMVIARDGAMWWLQFQALSNGVAIEVPGAGLENPFVFINTGVRGPLGGEVLHYELRLRLRTLRNLRDVRATLSAAHPHSTVERQLRDFAGSLPRGYERTLRLATLEVEYRGMTSGHGMVPHSATSQIRMALLDDDAFAEVSPSSMHEFGMVIRHASGEASARLLLWISGGVPVPGSLRILDGQVALRQPQPSTWLAT